MACIKCCSHFGRIMILICFFLVENDEFVCVYARVCPDMVCICVIMRVFVCLCMSLCASLCLCLSVHFCVSIIFEENIYALRVVPAETRLTVYRRRPVNDKGGKK